MKKKNARLIMLIGLLLLISPQAYAELILRGGYLMKMLPTSEEYNKFLKERYGAENLQLEGTAISAAFKSRGSSWGIGLEIDDLSGNINYKTLNGYQQQNKMSLKNTLLFLALYPRSTPNLEIDLGYGSGKLTRDFYGYQSPNIVTSNIGGQLGAQEASTNASSMMLQVLYRLLGNKFRFEAGARYSLSKHSISNDDLRPGYDETGIPASMDFNMGGLGLIGTFTIRF